MNTSSDELVKQNLAVQDWRMSNNQTLERKRVSPLKLDGGGVMRKTDAHTDIEPRIRPASMGSA